MKTINKYITLLLSAALLCSCENNSIIEGHDHDHGDHGTEEEQVQLSEKQLDIIDFKLGDFTEMNLGENIKCSGKLELPPQNKASVSALVGGRVKSISVIEGTIVKKGQTLAVLEHPDIISFQEDYLDVANNMSVLKNNYERKKVLFEDSITSRKDFEQAESDYHSAEAKLAALKAKLSLIGISAAQVEKGNISSGISIKSPINGSVRLIEINIGKFVASETKMFEIVDNDHVHIDLHVYEQDINKIVIGQKVLFSLASNENEVFEAKVFAIGKAFENDSKSVRVHAELVEEHTNLLPGMFVNALIESNPSKKRVLPNDAIVSEGENEYIFIQPTEQTPPHDDHGHGHESHAEHDAHGHAPHKVIFEKIAVKTGNSDLGFTEIIETGELPPHTGVVVKGAFYLHAEMKKGEAGHVH